MPAGLTDPRDRHNRGPGYEGVVEALALRGETLPEAAARQSRWMPFDADQHAVLHAQYRRDLAWLDAGAEGLAIHLDGRTPPDRTGRARPAGQRVVPARGPAPNGGLNHGIEKGVG